jgi:hypothetical protein
LLAKKNTFQGTIGGGGGGGVWQRPRRGKRSRGGSGTIGRLEIASRLRKLHTVSVTV